MIVLLTDFGRSEYVGVMKGVIYAIAPDARIVDLCHTIAAQSVIEASWVLRNNYKYFPKGSTFCCVVDPGVGSERKAIAVRGDNYYFVGPDNGLLWETVNQQKTMDVREIPVPADASRTFHGRDVFAKAAARIELGQFEKLGARIETIEKLELYSEGRKGIVVRIDAFGNVITNLDKLEKDEYTVRTGEDEYTMRYFANYHGAREGKLFLIEGSNKSLEISVKNGSANDKLNLAAGRKIEIF